LYVGYCTLLSNKFGEGAIFASVTCAFNFAC
jgi:hypothetical protein